MNSSEDRLAEAVKLLNQHHDHFYSLVDVARRTGHPVPMDTRGWSQVLVSVLTGTSGLERKKGADLADGSDVKGANTWEAIDTPRFNGVIKAGTKAATSDSMKSLDDMPYLFLVMWDHTAERQARCRIWCVRPQKDKEFRAMCEAWYGARAGGTISSKNFQLHPPRGLDGNLIKNTYGSLQYPLLFCAVMGDSGYETQVFDPDVLDNGECTKGDGKDVAIAIETSAAEDLGLDLDFIDELLRDQTSSI